MGIQNLSPVVKKYRLADGTWSTDYAVGDVFVKVMLTDYGAEPLCHEVGSVVRLERDDGSSCPLFKTVEGKCGLTLTNGESGCYEGWSNLMSDFNYYALKAIKEDV